MRIAVTGGIAEGKSTVLAMLQRMGYGTVSSDQVAREVFEWEEVQSLISDLCGHPGEKVSRDELRGVIASSNEKRRALNRIMHPRIRAEMDGSQVPFHEVPLLIEACLYGHYDEVWVVTCGPQLQKSRLLDRLGDPEAVDRILATQLPTEMKLAFADEVIHSNFPVEEVEARVRDLANHRFRHLRV